MLGGLMPDMVVRTEDALHGTERRSNLQWRCALMPAPCYFTGLLSNPLVLPISLR